MKHFFTVMSLLAVIFVAGCTQPGPTTTVQTTTTQEIVIPSSVSSVVPTVVSTVSTTPASSSSVAISTVQTTTSTSSNTIEITSSGFNPSTLTINAGDTVIFVNKDTQAHWPASNPHPVHTGYPETGSCGGHKFDSCRGLSTNEAFSLTFNIRGTWGYHDHINPGLGGTIIVQ